MIWVPLSVRFESIHDPPGGHTPDGGREKGMKNGFVICPSNSDSEVKRIASYISTKAQAEGIKDGIDFINTQIKNRNKTQPEETER